MLARDIMSTRFTAIAPDATLYEASTVMAETGFTVLPIVNPNRWLLGLLTKSDLILAGNHLGTLQAHMRPSSLAADTGTALHELANRMLETHLRTLPVLDNGQVVGVVTFRNVLHALKPR